MPGSSPGMTDASCGARKAALRTHTSFTIFKQPRRFSCKAVIASEAKQSILSLRGEMDCFASLAKTLLYFHRRLRDLAARRARVVHLSLAQKRAWGMPDARCTRGLVCALRLVKSTRVYEYTGITRHSRTQWF